MTFILCEKNADLSTLDAKGLSIEGKRESLRQARENRELAREKADQEKGDRSVDRWQRVVLLCVWSLATLVATAVVLVGLIGGSTELVRAGLVALCILAGAGLIPLPQKAENPKVDHRGSGRGRSPLSI